MKKSKFYYEEFELFNLIVKGDKNDQIHDIYPHIYKGVDLFSKYHNQPINLAFPLLLDDMYNLACKY